VIKCPKHPTYKGIRIPRYKSKGLENDCCACYIIYLAKREGIDLAWITMPDGDRKLVEL